MNGLLNILLHVYLVHLVMWLHILSNIQLACQLEELHFCFKQICRRKEKKKQLIPPKKLKGSFDESLTHWGKYQWGSCTQRQRLSFVPSVRTISTFTSAQGLKVRQKLKKLRGSSSKQTNKQTKKSIACRQITHFSHHFANYKQTPESWPGYASVFCAAKGGERAELQTVKSWKKKKKKRNTGCSQSAIWTLKYWEPFSSFDFSSLRAAT